MKNKKIAFLIDKSNPWIFYYYKKYCKIFFKKVKILWCTKQLKKFDIIFVLNFTKKIPSSKINLNSLYLVIHESALPKGKGFAPIQWQILKNKKKIVFSMFKLNDKIDSGPIVMQKKLYLNGNELYDEIRYLQAKKTFQMIKEFLKKYPNIKYQTQKGRSTFFKRRTHKDSELNINKSILNQFNKLRLANNEKWPAFFVHNKKKYILKIYKK
ncbi:formyltransferase family protein [Candidatus Pelagibacter sp.]|nr:formyltransferase family protein [Candidatus Pelagibacter sp.]